MRPPTVDAAFLRIAVVQHRERLLEAVRAVEFKTSAHLELDVLGLPGVRRVAVFVWPSPLGRPRRLTVDVVRLDAQTLKEPVSLSFLLTDSEQPRSGGDELPPVEAGTDALDEVCESGRPRAVRVAGPEGPVTWRLVEHPGTEKEVQCLDANGAPQLALVDTGVYCYRLTCPRCGRVRYSKPNSLHQVFWCRVCTRQDRLRKRALSQYKSRHGKRRR